MNTTLVKYSHHIPSLEFFSGSLVSAAFMRPDVEMTGLVVTPLSLVTYIT